MCVIDPCVKEMEAIPGRDFNPVYMIDLCESLSTSRRTETFYGPLRTLYGPLWTPYGPLWTPMDPMDHLWTSMDPMNPIWTPMDLLWTPYRTPYRTPYGPSSPRGSA
jgi:hypothetical protein